MTILGMIVLSAIFFGAAVAHALPEISDLEPGFASVCAGVAAAMLMLSLNLVTA